MSPRAAALRMGGLRVAFPRATGLRAAFLRAVSLPVAAVVRLVRSRARRLRRERRWARELRLVRTRAGDRAVRVGANGVGHRVASDAGLAVPRHRLVPVVRSSLVRQETWGQVAQRNSNCKVIFNGRFLQPTDSRHKTETGCFGGTRFPQYLGRVILHETAREGARPRAHPNTTPGTPSSCSASIKNCKETESG